MGMGVLPVSKELKFRGVVIKPQELHAMSRLVYDSVSRNSESASALSFSSTFLFSNGQTQISKDPDIFLTPAYDGFPEISSIVIEGAHAATGLKLKLELKSDFEKPVDTIFRSSSTLFVQGPNNDIVSDISVLFSRIVQDLEKRKWWLRDLEFGEWFFPGFVALFLFLISIITIQFPIDGVRAFLLIYFPFFGCFWYWKTIKLRKVHPDVEIRYGRLRDSIRRRKFEFFAIIALDLIIVGAFLIFLFFFTPQKVDFINIFPFPK
jgi:hypothetical protein